MKCSNLILIAFLLFIGSCESSFTRLYHHHMSAGDSESAILLLREELEKNSNNVDANYFMGSHLLKTRSYIEANTYFNQSTQLSFKHADQIEYLRDRHYRLEYNRGIDHFLAHEYKEAAQYFEKANEIIPGKQQTYLALGQSHYGDGNNAAAISVMKSCLEVYAQNYECSVWLIKSLYMQGDFESVKTLATQFANFHRNNLEFTKALIFSHLEMGENDLADRKFMDYFKIEKDFQFLKEFAIELFNKQDYVKAEKLLKEYFKFNSSDEDVLQALSYVFLEFRDYQLLVQVNKILYERSPYDRGRAQRLMISYELLGDMDSYKFMKRLIEEELTVKGGIDNHE